MPLGVLPAGAIAQRMGGQFVVGMLGILLLLTTALILVTDDRRCLLEDGGTARFD